VHDSNKESGETSRYSDATDNVGRMRRTSFRGWPCSIARTVDLIGDAWTVLVIRELFYGQTRFDGFVDSLGIARNTLTDRLTLLAEGGVVERREYQVDPVRHEYRLTTQGRDLFGVLAAINAWGDRWLTGPEGIPVLMHHGPCGHDLQPQVTCATCRQVVTGDEITLRPGPAYPDKLASHPDVGARFERANRHA
jgi:DNA-binding HxlR family transcriptional regulator